MQKRNSRRIVIASRKALLFLLVSHAFPQPSLAPSFGFTPAAQPAGLMGVSAAIGDFNGDGNPDIATANGSNRITVVFGDGKGNFSQPIATTGLRGPSALTIADLNGDGKLDLVSYNRPYIFTTTPPNEGLSVLLGNGDGSFVEVASYPTFARGQLNSAFNPLVVADFDRDGRPDIAIVNASSNSLDVMLGNGDGTFRPPVSYATGYYAVTFVVTGDFNGDGNADLITINGFFGLPDQTLTLLVGLGDGTFASPVSFPSKLPFNSEISGLAAADFNHDGNLDLIVSTAVVSGVTVYLGNGDGSFAAPVLYPSAKSGSFLALFSAGIAIGDVTADGNADAVTVNYANNSAYVQVFPGNGDGTFQTPAVLPSWNCIPVVNSSGRSKRRWQNGRYSRYPGGSNRSFEWNDGSILASLDHT